MKILRLIFLLGATTITAFGQNAAAAAAAAGVSPGISEPAKTAPEASAPFRFVGTHFSVLTPVAMVKTVKPTDPTAKTAGYISWRGKKDGNEYAVNVFEAPGAQGNSSFAQDMLDKMIAAVAQGMHGKIRSTQTVTFDGYHARDVVMTALSPEGEVQVDCRFIFADGAMFQVILTQPAAKADPAIAQAFFQSFQLTDLPAASVAKPALVETKSEAGRFSVMAPLALTESEKAGAHSFNGDQTFTDYLVVYNENFFTEGQAAAPLLAARAQALADKMSGKIVSQKTLALDGNPGLEAVIQATKNGIAVTQIVHLYAVGKRFYLLQYLKLGDVLDRSAADDFLNSFKLLPAAKSPPST